MSWFTKNKTDTTERAESISEVTRREESVKIWKWYFDEILRWIIDSEQSHQEAISRVALAAKIADLALDEYENRWRGVIK